MKFPEKGLSKEEVLNKIKAKKSNDFDWKSGKIFCSVYDGGEEAQEVVKEAYSYYLSENPVDPTLFPSLRDMETEVVAMSSEILRGGDEAVGALTSGGTESILLAIKTAKNRAKALKPHIRQPEVILPYTVHSAFFKACDYFDCKPVITKLTGDYRADAKAIEEAITENTILITASAPSYVFGVVDPIEEIGKIAEKNQIPFHVDACIGGIVLSFARLGGENVPNFDFSVPGVTSISMDWHKYGYAAKGCSVLIHKNKDYRKYQFFVCTEWSGYTLVNSTILSTKSGGPIAGCWAAIHYFGKEGYINLAKQQLDTTRKFVEGINKIEGLYVMGSPDSSLLSFTSDKLSIYDLMDEMVDRGWHLQFQLSNEYSKANLHLTVMRPHAELVEQLLSDLQEAVNVVNKKGFLKKAGTKATVKTVATLAKNMSPENFEKLGKMLGFSNGKVPDKLALVNEIMDTLPEDTVKNTLLEYFNDFYTYQEER